MERDSARKTGIYGINFILPSLENLVKDVIPKMPEIVGKGLDTLMTSANPGGAAFFGGLDLSGRVFSKKITENALVRLLKLGGTAFYGVKTVFDVYSIVNGEYTPFVDLAFDTSMMYQLGKDSVSNYQGKTVEDDLKALNPLNRSSS